MDSLTRKYCLALSIVLDYPSETPWETSGRITALLTKRDGGDKVEQSLSRLAEELRRLSLDDLRREYAAVFALKPECSPGMIWHIHGGISGQELALAGLSELHADAGYTLSDVALPEHLPVMLECMSVAPQLALTAIGEDVLTRIQALGSRLADTESVYAFAGQALAALAEVLRSQQKACCRSQ